MTDSQPKQIICAVRGGAESRDTVSRVIQLALETGARLTFLHVMDAEFLQYATIGPLSVVYNGFVGDGHLCDDDSARSRPAPRRDRRGITWCARAASASSCSSSPSPRTRKSWWSVTQHAVRVATCLRQTRWARS